MRARRWTAAAGAIALAVATVDAVAATADGRATFKAAQKQATADYNAARAHCRTLSGHPRSVCIAEAKSNLKKAEADAEAAYRDTAHARLDAHIASAHADYAVAKAKCNAQSGDARKACIKEARARQSEAITRAIQADRAPTAEARAPAATKSP